MSAGIEITVGEHTAGHGWCECGDYLHKGRCRFGIWMNYMEDQKEMPNPKPGIETALKQRYHYSVSLVIKCRLSPSIWSGGFPPPTTFGCKSSNLIFVKEATAGERINANAPQVLSMKKENKQ